MRVSMEVDQEEVEDKSPRDNLVFKKVFEACKCAELEERCEKAEARCTKLALEIQKRTSECEAVEAKFKALEAEKIAIEAELRALRQRNNELNERICHIREEEKVACRTERKTEGVVDLTEENGEEDAIIQLMMENSALKCEKKKAESEVELWKENFKKLQLMVFQRDQSLISNDVEWPLSEKTKLGLGSIGKGIGHLETAASPYNVTPYTHTSSIERGVLFKSEAGYGTRVARHLAFQEDRSPCKKIAPSTPGGSKPSSLSVIDIFDSDDESDVVHTQRPSRNDQQNEKVLTENALEGTAAPEKEPTFEDISKRTKSKQGYGEMVDVCQDSALFLLTPRRKRACNVVSSDTESDDNDDIPIHKFKRLHVQEIIPDQASSELKRSPLTASPPGEDNVTGKPSRRRLVSLRQCEGKGKAKGWFSSEPSETKRRMGIPATEDVQDDKSAEDGSDSTESDHLGGFIVDSSGDSTGGDASSESQNESDANLDFDEILSTLGRNKGHKSKWEYEADMLAAFGKDPELCMKAVCALYRQQTSDERISKEALHQNQRGFSKFDALRGTTLGEFLTDGDPQGDLKKSVKQLQQYDSKAVELCRRLATHYSKQLFEIYKNKEDPFFLPS